MAETRLELDAAFSVPDGVPVQLRFMTDQPGSLPSPDRVPVLLLHGASAQHETFCIPKEEVVPSDLSEEPPRSLVRYLWDQHYEPWLLDWRGSCRVTRDMNHDQLAHHQKVLDLDNAAGRDIPSAFERILAARADFDPCRVHVVAHCLGAAAFSQALASGFLPIEKVGRVVLLTIGLFYKPPIDGMIKSQFHVLDRLARSNKTTLIDPTRPNAPKVWPEEVQKIYSGIGAGIRPHPTADVDPMCSHAVCNRVSFMYGRPFRHDKLVEQIHGSTTLSFTSGAREPRLGERVRARFITKDEPEGDPFALGIVQEVDKDEATSWRKGDASGTLNLGGCGEGFHLSMKEERDGYFELLGDDDRRIANWNGTPDFEIQPQIAEQFGGIPLRMYLQGTLNVRRGWAAPLSPDFALRYKGDGVLIGGTARKRFQRAEAVTMITGEFNQLWSRESIDRMHEWAIQGLGLKERTRIKKRIMTGYGHQDLLWGGKASERDVFPVILDDGLGGPKNFIEFGEVDLDDPLIHDSS